MLESPDPLRSRLREVAESGQSRAAAVPAEQIAERGQRRRRRMAFCAAGACLVLAGGGTAAGMLLGGSSASVAPATSPSDGRLPSRAPSPMSTLLVPTTEGSAPATSDPAQGLAGTGSVTGAPTGLASAGSQGRHGGVGLPSGPATTAPAGGGRGTPTSPPPYHAPTTSPPP